MRRQAGFSLIEILVAGTILAIGVLGLARLQLAALRWSADASVHATATRLAQELAEKLRSNPAQVDVYLAASSGTAEAVAACYTGTGCSADARARTDMAEWRAALTAALPGAAAILCRDASPDDGRPQDPACSAGASDPLVLKFWWSARAPNGQVTSAETLSAPLGVVLLRI